MMTRLGAKTKQELESRYGHGDRQLIPVCERKMRLVYTTFILK